MPLTKRQRRRAKVEEEARVRAAELRQLQAPAPQSATDFEKLVCLKCCVSLLRAVCCSSTQAGAGAGTDFHQAAARRNAGDRGLTMGRCMWFRFRAHLASLGTL